MNFLKKLNNRDRKPMGSCLGPVVERIQLEKGTGKPLVVRKLFYNLNCDGGYMIIYQNSSKRTLTNGWILLYVNTILIFK